MTLQHACIFLSQASRPRLRRAEICVRAGAEQLRRGRRAGALSWFLAAPDWGRCTAAVQPLVQDVQRHLLAGQRLSGDLWTRPLDARAWRSCRCLTRSSCHHERRPSTLSYLHSYEGIAVDKLPRNS